VIADVNEEAGQTVVTEIERAAGERAVEQRMYQGLRLPPGSNKPLGVFAGIDIPLQQRRHHPPRDDPYLSEEDWDRVMAVNVKSIFLLSREVIPHMQKAAADRSFNTASVGDYRRRRARCIAHLRAQSCCSRKPWRSITDRQNIRVNCICPGDTDTNAAQ